MRELVAGIMIALSCMGYLALDGGILGAIIFTTGLVSICATGAQLYTGMVGFAEPTKKDAKQLLAVLLGNLIGTLFISSCASGEIREKAAILVERKLSTGCLELFISAFLCGILVYVGVLAYKKTQSFIPLILAVSLFVVCGFNHCIADSFYYFTSKISAQMFGKLGLEILGNTLGALSIRFLYK